MRAGLAAPNPMTGILGASGGRRAERSPRLVGLAAYALPELWVAGQGVFRSSRLRAPR